jgi:hypothetical protein
VQGHSSEHNLNELYSHSRRHYFKEGGASSSDSHSKRKPKNTPTATVDSLYLQPGDPKHTNLYKLDSERKINTDVAQSYVSGLFRHFGGGSGP